MKKFIGFFLMLLSSLCICSSNNEIGEKEYAQKNIIELKERIKREENAYKLAMEYAIDDQEEKVLTQEYKQKRQTLFKQIQQQRDIINQSSSKQLLWNSAKIVGPIALMGLMIYAFFTSSPVELEKPLLTEEPALINTTPNIPVPPIQISNQPETILPSNLPPSLTTDYYEQYRKKSNTYGNMTAVLGLVAVLSGNVILLPVIASTYLGSLYYGMQALKNKN